MKSTLRVQPADAQALASLAPDLAALPLFVDYGQDVARLTASLQRALEAGEGLLVAVDAADSPVGLAWYVARGAFGLGAYLRLLAVVAGGQGRGAGRALLHAFEEATQSARGGQLVLCNAVNAPALAFYAAHGYAQVGVLRRFVRPQHDEVLLHRPPA